jgi:hypothetical protein
MPSSASQVWRDFVVAGVPSSGDYNPAKAEIRSWGARLESFIPALGSNASIYLTRAELFADLSKSAKTLAWVVEDDNAAYNGIYQKTGSAGAGSWSRVADLPYSFVQASDTGLGTPNAIQAETPTPVSESSIIVLSVGSTNTSSPVTVSFNGSAPIQIKDYTGSDILKNELRAGSIVFGIINSGVFRLLFDQAYGYLAANNSGSGSANAIQASVDAPVDYANPNSLISFNVTAANTASPVTVSFNSGAALTIRTASGANVAIGGLQTGMRPLGYIDGANFRILSDQASSAIVAQAEAAAIEAQGYRDEAADYAALARNDVVVSSFTGDGTTVDFTLAVDPGSKNNITVNISGTTQLKSSYSLVDVGGNPTLRFTEAPPNGVPFDVSAGFSIAVGAIGAGAVGTSQLANDAVTFAKLQNIATSRVIGRLSAGSGDPEELTPAQLQTIFLPSGSVLDRGFSSYAASTALSVALPVDDTIPQITEGTEVLKVTLTPKSTTSRFRARAVLHGTVGVQENWAAALFNTFTGSGTGALQVGRTIASSANFVATVVLEWEWVPGVTTAVDVTIRVGTNSGQSVYLNGSSAGRLFGGAAKATLVVEELKG